MFVIRWKTDKDHVGSYFSGTMSLGFGASPVWGDLGMARKFRTELAATKMLHKVGRYGKGYSVVALSAAEVMEQDEKAAAAARRAKAAK